MDKSRDFTDGTVDFIELKNPVSDAFDVFVFGNAVLSNKPVEDCVDCVALAMTAGSAAVSKDSPPVFNNVLAYKDEVVPWITIS